MREIKLGLKRPIGIFPGIALASACGAALAQGTQEVPMSASSEAGIIAFAVLFAGSCVVFVWVVWRNERKRKQNEKNAKG